MTCTANADQANEKIEQTPDVLMDWRPTGTVAALGLALTACGGSGSSNESAGKSLGYSLLSSTITPQEASRFLSQAAFGGNDQAIADVINAGYSTWLDQQMAMARSQSYKDWLIEKNYHDGSNDSVSGNVTTYGGWDFNVWRKCLSSPDVLRQRMVLAWTQLFVVSYAGIAEVLLWRNFALANYLDKFEEHAFGNFRQILEFVTLSTAMGAYLGTLNNRKANPAINRVPDENFAREIMQLFTIGLYELNDDGTKKIGANGQPIDTYSNLDIQGLARVFTGWVHDWVADPAGVLTDKRCYYHFLPMFMNEYEHEPGEKRFLGTVIPAGTNGKQSLKIALDVLFNHANTPAFVAKHFIARFVTSNPSVAYVKRVADAFRNNGQGVRGDMASVMKAVLLDTEARQTTGQPYEGKLREPMIRFMQFARTFGAYSPDGGWKMEAYQWEPSIGQFPMTSPSVFNFFRPGYVPPQTPLSGAGLVAPEFQIANEPAVVSYVNGLGYFASNVQPIRLSYDAELPYASDSQTLVNRYNLLFAAGQLSANTVQTIKTAIDSISPSTTEGKLKRIRAASLLVTCCPEYLILK